MASATMEGIHHSRPVGGHLLCSGASAAGTSLASAPLEIGAGESLVQDTLTALRDTTRDLESIVSLGSQQLPVQQRLQPTCHAIISAHLTDIMSLFRLQDNLATQIKQYGGYKETTRAVVAWLHG